MIRMVIGCAAVAAALAASSCSSEDPSRDHCPNRDDPKVHYVSQDAHSCETMRFQCVLGTQPFDNECGCGCIEE